MENNIPNIWQMQTEGDIDSLCKALAHPSPEIRRRAAVALRIMDARAAMPSLQTQLKKETSAQVRVALSAAIEHLTPPKNATETPFSGSTRVERLIEHLMGARPEVALQAAIALGELNDKLAVPPLILVFKNRKQPPKVRLAVAEALLKMNSAPAEVTLLGALRSEKWHLRRNGAAILGQISADWAVEPLAKALHDEHPIVAKTARAALKRIGTPEARQALVLALRSETATDTLTDTLDTQPTQPTNPAKTDKLRKLQALQQPTRDKTDPQRRAPSDKTDPRRSKPTVPNAAETPPTAAPAANLPQPTPPKPAPKLPESPPAITETQRLRSLTASDAAPDAAKRKKSTAPLPPLDITETQRAKTGTLPLAPINLDGIEWKEKPSTQESVGEDLRHQFNNLFGTTKSLIPTDENGVPLSKTDILRQKSRKRKSSTQRLNPPPDED